MCGSDVRANGHRRAAGHPSGASGVGGQKCLARLVRDGDAFDAESLRRQIEEAIEAGLATWSDWVMGSVSTKHAPPLTSRSRRKSPPMLRLSLRHKASPRPTPGAECAASCADLLKG